MKNLFSLEYLVLVICVVMLSACSKDESSGEVYVYFADKTMNLAEDFNESLNIPIQVYSEGNLNEDLQISYTIAGEGTDRIMDETGGSITLEKGYESYIGYIAISAVNNDTGDGDAELTISLSSSDPSIIFGLGPNNDNNTLTLKVLDDECTKQIDVFPGTLINNATYGNVDININAALDGNTLTINGDLIGYSPLGDATLGIMLTPSSEGASDGKAIFEEGEIGTDSDNYDYYLIQDGEGTYDACIGEIRISFYVYYYEDGAWVYWYRTDNVITLP